MGTIDKELEDLLNWVDSLLSRLVERDKDNQRLSADAQEVLNRLRKYRERKELPNY